jgi:tetratricopeptide (TPR) repeat protein
VDPVGPKHAKLLEFLATRGQVEFDLKQVKRARQLLKDARAELLGPLPTKTTATIIDGWVRRITLSCREARELWPEIAAAPPALARLEEIEVLFDDELDAWVEVAARHPLRVTRFHLNGEYVNQDTGEILAEGEGSADMVAAAAALSYATELVFELYFDETSSLAALDLPELTTLWVDSDTYMDEAPDNRVLGTLWQARCPQLRRLGWETSKAIDPAVALAAPSNITELGFWSSNRVAVLEALVANRPSLTAIGMADRNRDEPDDLDDDALRRLGEGRRMFGPRCTFHWAFNAGHRLLHALEREAEGAEHFAALRGRNAHDADVHFQCGNAVTDLYAKVDAYCEALIVDPDHLPSHANLGDTLLDLGRPRIAIPHVRRYLDANPTFAGGWRNMAKAHRALGEEAEALAAEAKIPPDEDDDE